MTNPKATKQLKRIRDIQDKIFETKEKLDDTMSGSQGNVHDLYMLLLNAEQEIKALYKDIEYTLKEKE